jgi:hypothetical protein
MSVLKDDLDAVRTVIDAIKDFKSDEQQRIFRWVAEKLGLPQPFAASVHSPPATPIGAAVIPAPPPIGTTTPTALPPQTRASSVDIKTFIDNKKPRSDVQFAAAVAYYYRFEAPQTERKDAINKEDLQDAARKASRDRFTNPRKTLQNAHQLGMLDRGSEKATFTINSVGENLVAMTLPGDGANNVKPKKSGRKPAHKTAKPTARKPSKKV